MREKCSKGRVHERHNKVGAVCCLLVCRGFLTGSAAGAASIAGTVPAAASLKRFRGCRGPTWGLELCWCALCPALQTQAGLRGLRDAWGALAARASPALGPRCCTPSLHPANQPPRAAYQTPLTLPPSLSLSPSPPLAPDCRFALLICEVVPKLVRNPVNPHLPIYCARRPAHGGSCRRCGGQPYASLLAGR
jgi:hypothetical protein